MSFVPEMSAMVELVNKHFKGAILNKVNEFTKPSEYDKQKILNDKKTPKSFLEQKINIIYINMYIYCIEVLTD